MKETLNKTIHAIFKIDEKEQPKSVDILVTFVLKGSDEILKDTPEVRIIFKKPPFKFMPIQFTTKSYGSSAADGEYNFEELY
jgi:hypothetical protein